ncbi:MAG: PAS domain-containing protein [Bacteroidota bacterium]
MDYGDFNATINSILRNEPLQKFDESLNNYVRYRSGKLTADVLSMVWKYADNGMIITDSDGKILSVNDAFCILANTDEKAVIGSGFTDLFDDTIDHTPLYSMYSNQLHSSNGAARGEYYIQFRTGESRVAEIIIHRLVDEADEVFMFIEFYKMKEMKRR